MKRLIILTSVLLSSIFAFSQRECNVKKTSLTPIIATLNPFFTDHEWNKRILVEKARLDAHRSIVISQFGCKRHHISIRMRIKANAVQQSENFYIQETLSMMRMIYFGNPTYAHYRKIFEKNFTKNFHTYGLGQEFNFPIGSSTFICSVRSDPVLGVQISVEQATYVFAENLQKEKDLTPRKKDDGWFKKE